MDFKKITRIFILAFAGLNIYLIWGILGRQGIQYIGTQTVDSDIQLSMESLDIEVPNPEDIQFTNQNVFALQINSNTLFEDAVNDNDDLKGTLSESGTYYASFPSKPIVLEGNPEDGFAEEDYDLLQEFILSNQVMLGEEYSNLHYNSYSRRFVCYQYVNEVPIVDGTSEISLFVNEEGEVYAFQQTYAGPATPQGQSLDLIDGSRAIELLFLNNEIRQGSEVKTPILTYNRALHLEDLSTYSPVWLVYVEHPSGPTVLRVDAVDGTIIRDQDASSDSNQEDDDELEEDSSDNSEKNDGEVLIRNDF